LLKVTASDGCTDTISHIVTIADTPVVDAGKDTFVCAGNAVILQPSGATSYTWQSSPYLSCINCTNPSASPTDTTVFYVTGFNASGCSSSDSVKVLVQQQQQLTVSPLNAAICAGDTIQLRASGMDNYSWQPATGLTNPNAGSTAAFPSSNTIYSVTGKR